MKNVWNDLTKVSEFRLELYPKDFKVTRTFYEEMLKFPVIHEWNDDDKKGVMFDTGAGVIELLSREDGDPTGTSCGLSLQVKNVWELWKQFEQSAIVVFPLRHNDWGDTSFRITDPDGLEISFFTKD